MCVYFVFFILNVFYIKNNSNLFNQTLILKLFEK